MSNPLRPLALACLQLGDPAFLGVVARSLACSAAGFIGLAFGAAWGLRHLLPAGGGWGWIAGLLGGAGAVLAALWLYLPLAVVIAAFDLDRVARAVDRRFYPLLPEPRGASLAMQLWDGLALGGQVLALNLAALLLALLLPGLGWAVGWAVAAWAVGRGLFVAVAMRRMDRPAAQALYLRHRPLVLAQGAALVLAGWVPGLNLLVPVLGTAAMVHVLHGPDR